MTDKLCCGYCYADLDFKPLREMRQFKQLIWSFKLVTWVVRGDELDELLACGFVDGFDTLKANLRDKVVNYDMNIMSRVLAKRQSYECNVSCNISQHEYNKYK